MTTMTSLPTLPASTPAPTRPLPRSVYVETAPPPIDAPPLEGDRRAAVVMIGGGFTGLSAALHLAERGVDVAVLEANEPGWGASGRNGGQVNPGLKHEPDEIERDFGPDLGARMVRLSGEAPNQVFDLIRRLQIVCEASQGGTIRAVFSRKRTSTLRDAHAQAVRRNLPVELLEADAMRAVTSTRRYVCALRDRRGGQVNPLAYARGLALAAQRAGARVHAASPARRLHRNGAGWVIETPSGKLRAEHVVLATNGYTDGLLPTLRRTVVPVYSAIAATAPLPPSFAASILPEGSVLYEIGAITTYYRIDRAGRLLMGGRSRQRDMDRMGQYRHLVAYAERLWPALAGTPWTHCWNGQVALTTDHYPHFHEPMPGVIACLGYNGRGVAMGTVMGEQIARRVLGQEIDMPITTMKAIPFHGLWRQATALRIAYGRIRDFLSS